MPLTRDQHNIALARHSNRSSYRHRTIAFAFNRHGRFRRNPSENLVNNRFGRFRSWIITRHNHMICVRHRGQSHSWSLRTVAISATTKDKNNFPRANNWTKCRQDIRERIVCVGIIHKHCKRIAWRSDRFQSARRRRCGIHRCGNRCTIDSNRPSRCRSLQRIHRVMTTNAREVHFNIAPRTMQFQPSRSQRNFHRVCEALGLRILRTATQNVCATTFKHCAMSSIVDIHNCTTTRTESPKEPSLCLRIRIHRLVIIQMIAGQICKDTNREIDLVDATLIKRVARNFHCSDLALVANHSTQNPR